MKLKYLNDPQQQTCKICGKKDKFDFNVPEKTWEAVVPPMLQNHVVCLACFDALATEKKIDYSKAINVLYFAGESSSIVFSVQRTN